jgi:hypothetical protein
MYSRFHAGLQAKWPAFTYPWCHLTFMELWYQIWWKSSQLFFKNVPLKHRFLQQPYGITSQKTAFFIITAMKTTNLTQHYPAGLCSWDIMCFLWGMNWVFISQKMAFFIVTAVKISNLTWHSPAGLCSRDVMCLLWGTNCFFYIPEDGILHSHRCENLKLFFSYYMQTCDGGSGCSFASFHFENNEIMEPFL